MALHSQTTETETGSTLIGTRLSVVNDHRLHVSQHHTFHPEKTVTNVAESCCLSSSQIGQVVTPTVRKLAVRYYGKREEQ